MSSLPQYKMVDGKKQVIVDKDEEATIIIKCEGAVKDVISSLAKNSNHYGNTLTAVITQMIVDNLDDYAVGFKKYVDITIDDILSDKFIGLVKCDVIPPKDLYVPVLPDNTNGKLLFHLNPMYEKTWCSVE